MLCRKTAALMKIDYYPASQLSDTDLTNKGMIRFLKQRDILLYTLTHK